MMLILFFIVDFMTHRQLVLGVRCRVRPMYATGPVENAYLVFCDILKRWAEDILAYYAHPYTYETVKSV